MKWTLLFALASSLAAAGAGSGSALVYRVHGGGPSGRIKETLKVLSDDTVELETRAPFPGVGMERNTIGSFRQRVGGTYARIQQLMKETRAKVPAARKLIPDTLIREIEDGAGALLKWTREESAPYADKWDDLLIELRSSLLRSPVSAITLDCEGKGGRWHCRYANSGSQSVVTVNPELVPYAIWCWAKSGLRTPLNPSPDYEPNKIAPPLVTVPAGQAFAFSVPRTGDCQRFSVGTFEVGANPHYLSYLLGELYTQVTE